MKSKILILLLALVSVSAFGQRTKVQDLEIQKRLFKTGECTPSAISTDQDDYTLDDGCTIFKLSASTPVTISGFTGGSKGREIVVTNVGSNSITLTHEDDGSTAANRMLIPGHGQVVMEQYSTVNLRYDNSLSRWLVMSSNGGDATDGWPLSGTGSISGSSTINFDGLALGAIYVAPDTLAFDVSATGGHSGPRISFYLNPFPESRGHVSIGTANIVGADSVRLSFESYIDSTRAVFYDWRDQNKRGIEYAEYDSTQWTGSTLVTKAYVDGKVSSGAFWPLTGTAALTGNVTINGGGTRDLSLGSSGSRLDDLSLYADNQALINVASGNNVNRVILQPGLSSFALIDTDGETLDVQILVQPGEADILRIVKDESVTVFEINADGSIVYGAPPTDCTGLAPNTIWSDSGTLKLCP